MAHKHASPLDSSLAGSATQLWTRFRSCSQNLRTVHSRRRSSRLLAVARLVPQQLREPVAIVAVRLAPMRRAAMPEASIYKNGEALAAKTKWQPPCGHVARLSNPNGGRVRSRKALCGNERHPLEGEPEYGAEACRNLPCEWNCWLAPSPNIARPPWSSSVCVLTLSSRPVLRRVARFLTLTNSPVFTIYSEH